MNEKFRSLNILKPEDFVFWYMCGDTVVSPGLASAAKAAFFFFFIPFMLLAIDSHRRFLSREKVKPWFCVSFIDIKRGSSSFNCYLSPSDGGKWLFK